MTIKDKFEGCIIGGAIGDAYGSAYENQHLPNTNSKIAYLFGASKLIIKHKWQITDDTQLTLATCEALIESKKSDPEKIAQKFADYYKLRRITGIGASTLKSVQELSAGIHWSQAGRRGEYAAGNGAAMRIAPIAFMEDELNRKHIEDISRITHYNDEAYTGALSVALCLGMIIKQNWTGNESLIEMVIENIPDTKVRDKLIALNKIQHTITIQEVGKRFGSSGYVAESVPLSIFAASKVRQIGLENMYDGLIAIGGDTDTNCSIAGQIAGTLLGIDGIPQVLKSKLTELQEYSWINNTMNEFIKMKGWNK